VVDADRLQHGESVAWAALPNRIGNWSLTSLQKAACEGRRQAGQARAALLANAGR